MIIKGTSVLSRLEAIPELPTVVGWKEVPVQDNGELLVALNGYSDLIGVDPQYFKQGIRGTSEILYARRGVAERLAKAATLLPPGYKLVIWDPWRSIETQQALFDKFYEQVKAQNPGLGDEEWQKMAQVYVSLPSKDPKKPSPHFTGGAVDLTIAGPDGKPLEMADFDDFSPRAATRFFETKAELTDPEKVALENRRLLYYVMTAGGFTNYHEEWWHFDFGNQFDAIRRDKGTVAVYGVPPNTPV